MPDQATVTVAHHDLAVFLAARGTGHAHDRRGVWDPDNRPGVAGKPCTLCQVYERLRAAVVGNLPPVPRP